MMSDGHEILPGIEMNQRRVIQDIIRDLLEEFGSALGSISRLSPSCRPRDLPTRLASSESSLPSKPSHYCSLSEVRPSELMAIRLPFHFAAELEESIERGGHRRESASDRPDGQASTVIVHATRHRAPVPRGEGGVGLRTRGRNHKGRSRRRLHPGDCQPAKVIHLSPEVVRGSGPRRLGACRPGVSRVKLCGQ